MPDRAVTDDVVAVVITILPNRVFVLRSAIFVECNVCSIVNTESNGLVNPHIEISRTPVGGTGV